MKKLIISLLACFLVIGCESEDDSKSGSSSDYDAVVTCVVQTHTPYGSGMIYDCGQYRVYVDDATVKYRTRESCSGFEEVGNNGFQEGDTLFCEVKSYDSINYANNPVELTPIKVEGWSSICLQGSGGGGGGDSDGCSTCDFFN
jgi:hypothetical protein